MKKKNTKAATSRPANRTGTKRKSRIGFRPKGTDLDFESYEDEFCSGQSDDHEDDPENEQEEKINNPFKELGLRPERIDYHANNPADRILAWYMSGSDQDLSAVDEWYHHVFKTAHTCQINGYTDSKIAKVLRKYFGLNSDRLAYKYIYAAQTLFGNVSKSDKEAMRYMLSQMAQSCYARAIKKGDVKAALLAIRVVNNINGLDRKDTWVPDKNALGGNTYIMQINTSNSLGTGSEIASEVITIDLNAPESEQEKLLQQVVDRMDQASKEDIEKMILKEADDQE